MKLMRAWAMPNAATFDIAPIGNFVRRHTMGCAVILDPFSNGKRVGTITNDLNPGVDADFHTDVLNFIRAISERRIVPDCVIFDPPYSPRQIAEVYKGVGRATTARETQRPGRWTEERDMIASMLSPGGIVLSFGWSSYGMGHRRGFVITELLLVCHGAGHNDTICIAEEKVQAGLFDGDGESMTRSHGVS